MIPGTLSSSERHMVRTQAEVIGQIEIGELEVKWVSPFSWTCFVPRGLESTRILRALSEGRVSQYRGGRGQGVSAPELDRRSHAYHS
jgi:hypothetical protein